MSRKTITLIGSCVFAGILGMKVATWVTDLYYDHQFLHAARMINEKGRK